MSTNAHTAAPTSPIPVAAPLNRVPSPVDQVIATCGHAVDAVRPFPEAGRPERSYLIHRSCSKHDDHVDPQGWQRIHAPSLRMAAAKVAVERGPGMHYVLVAETEPWNLRAEGTPVSCMGFSCDVGQPPRQASDAPNNPVPAHPRRVGGTSGSLDDWS
jgi:hypothetical protein